jgi:hypothetical protein
LAQTLLMALICCNIWVFDTMKTSVLFITSRLVRGMRSVCAHISVKPPRKVHERNRIVFIRMFSLFSFFLPKFVLDCLILEDGTDRLSRNVGT